MKRLQPLKTAWIGVLVSCLLLGCSLVPSDAPGRRNPHASWSWATETLTGLGTRLRALLTHPEPDGFTHTVNWPGENLSAISLWYTGSSANWSRLLRANPGIRPRQIKIGDSIQIPLALLRTTQPLPYSFLSAQIRSRPPALAPAKQAELSGSLELYGPIGIDGQGVSGGDQAPPLQLETIE